jgi:lipopolysaccharide transport system ATP-binding protein
MPAIIVDNITKVYYLYDSPTVRLKEALHPLRKKYHYDFYALKHVSFTVEQGEVLGIIGKNGSGKSTLLKILAGVLTPTSGTIALNGKVAALLELGGGFNPEFTGIENIYFNSSIMGYKKEEVDQKIDEIIAFADIGDFIHQPVKTYSSGMFVRLAFAVAINIEPDILIVDEALAVGDEAFQRKCFAKIQAIRERGATILFVSHAVGAVVELCQRAMLFDQGELILAGVPKFVVSKYHQLLYAEEDHRQALRENIKQDFLQKGSSSIAEATNSEIQYENKSQPVLKEFYDPNLKTDSKIVYSDHNDYGVRIRDVRITTGEGVQVNNLLSDRNYIYTYNVDFQRPAQNVRFGMLIKTVTGFELGGSATSPANDPIPFIEKNTSVTVQFRFTCLLHPGTYFMNAGVVALFQDNLVYLERIVDVLMFRVQPDEGIFETAVVSFLVEPLYSIKQ